MGRFFELPTFQGLASRPSSCRPPLTSSESYFLSLAFNRGFHFFPLSLGPPRRSARSSAFKTFPSFRSLFFCVRAPPGWHELVSPNLERRNLTKLRSLPSCPSFFLLLYRMCTLCLFYLREAFPRPALPVFTCKKRPVDVCRRPRVPPLLLIPPSFPSLFELIPPHYLDLAASHSSEPYTAVTVLVFFPLPRAISTPPCEERLSPFIFSPVHLRFRYLPFKILSPLLLFFFESSLFPLLVYGTETFSLRARDGGFFLLTIPCVLEHVYLVLR